MTEELVERQKGLVDARRTEIIEGFEGEVRGGVKQRAVEFGEEHEDISRTHKETLEKQDELHQTIYLRHRC